MNDTDALALLESLVCVPSSSTEEQHAVEFLVDHMRELGFEAHADDPLGLTNPIPQWWEEAITAAQREVQS